MRQWSATTADSDYTGIAACIAANGASSRPAAVASVAATARRPTLNGGSANGATLRLSHAGISNGFAVRSAVQPRGNTATGRVTTLGSHGPRRLPGLQLDYASDVVNAAGKCSREFNRSTLYAMAVLNSPLLRSCPHCSATFPRRGRKVYCCRRCRIVAKFRRQRARQGKVPPTDQQRCKWCRGPYRAIRRQQSYCSAACRQIASEHRRRARRGRHGDYIPKPQTVAKIMRAIRTARGLAND
jgi:hypothetical protein